jgi:hypothetical protein
MEENRIRQPFIIPHCPVWLYLGECGIVSGQEKPVGVIFLTDIVGRRTLSSAVRNYPPPEEKRR